MRIGNMANKTLSLKEGLVLVHFWAQAGAVATSNQLILAGSLLGEQVGQTVDQKVLIEAILDGNATAWAIKLRPGRLGRGFDALRRGRVCEVRGRRGRWRGEIGGAVMQGVGWGAEVGCGWCGGVIFVIDSGRTARRDPRSLFSFIVVALLFCPPTSASCASGCLLCHLRHLPDLPGID